MTSQLLLAAATAIGICASSPVSPTGADTPQPGAPQPDRTQAPHIDLAVCLDTSGSMRGLINSARQSIWAIINDLALSKPEPQLRIALLTFGNSGHDKAQGWVRVDAPLTDDLDTVSQQLFALTTNGGEEYVGRVLQTSLKKLEWSTQKDALKIIVVAGNESADQDKTVSYKDMCREAIGRDIIVNSIYCGNPADKIAPGWRDVAKLADGRFASIDKDHGNVAIATPFDTQLNALGVSLNKTYIPYGAQGKVGAANQISQDRNASSINLQVAAQRAIAKSCSNYGCGMWDLVDACKNKTVDLAKMKVEDMPENMQKMTPKERVEYVAKKEKERGVIQKQIGALTKKRLAHVAQEQKKMALKGQESFDQAVRQAVRAQAEAKGFKCQNH